MVFEKTNAKGCIVKNEINRQKLLNKKHITFTNLKDTHFMNLESYKKITHGRLLKSCLVTK